MKIVLIAALIAILGVSLGLPQWIIYILAGISLLSIMAVIGALNTAKKQGTDEHAHVLNLSKILRVDAYVNDIILESYGLFILIILSMLIQMGGIVILFFSSGSLLLLKELLNYMDEEYSNEIELAMKYSHDKKEKK